MTTSPYLAPGKRLGKLESRAPQVIAALLSGMTEVATADKFGCTKRGVQLFKQKHAQELAAIHAEASAIVARSWISDKVARVAKLQKLYDLTEAEIDQHGLITEQIMIAEDGGPITTRKYRHELVKEARGLLKDAAIEEGQIVPAAPNKGGMVREVIIREYEGVPQDWIG